MGLDLSTQIGKIKLNNPVLVASGTFGHGKEFEPFIDLRKLGGIVTKTITVKPRLGNPPQRIVETPSGMLNAIGLQNPGVEKFIEEKLPYFRKLKIPIIVSIMGYSVEELETLTARLEKEGGFDGYELNLSCPNVSYGTKSGGAKMFAHDEGMIREAVSAVRQKTTKTLIAKLGPDVSDIALMARAAGSAGADALALINTFIAMVIDPKTRKPVLANKTGGLSGPCVRPIAVRLTWEAAKAVKIPVVGIGGIMNAHDALEFLIAGASAIQVGTANFMNPMASIDVLEGLQDWMRREKVASLREIIGSIKV
ncbi:MAG TPA: dihydroorotate dehydrogenase [Candidatus Omnitrophota bacterium]|nr:dihydroorotate dehydrogenase [Candidatus Omnitrophota bacterium]